MGASAAPSTTRVLLSPRFKRGILQPDSLFCINPRRLVESLVAAAIALGTQFRQAEIVDIESRPDGPRATLAGGGAVRADRIVLAVPPAVASELLPDLEVPNESRPIVNVHIRLDRPVHLPEEVPFLGLVGGWADWLFLRGDVVSLTVSAARALAEDSSEAIGARLWQDTAAALRIPAEGRGMSIRVTMSAASTSSPAAAT